MEYDKEFEEYISGIPMSEAMRRNMKRAWQDARKDHYRIGEEVEARAHSQESFVRGVVTALISVGFAVDQPDNVRRIPAWTPKDGEAVFLFTGHENRVHVGKFDGFESDGRYKVITQSGECARTNAHYIKPFSANKIGKPWEEI